MARTGSQVRHLSLDGQVGMSYDSAGVGDTNIVMLHGLFGSPANWHAIMKILAHRFRFFALQLPIDPHQDRRHTDFHSIGQLTDHVQQCVDRLELNQVVLCGNSLGGQIALDFALRRPDLVKGLVLTGSAGLFERNVTGGKGLRYCKDTIRQQAYDVFYDPVHVTDDLVEHVYRMLGDRAYRRFLLKVSKATRDRHMQEELAAVGAPTMIIWGRNDSITPPFVAEEFRARLASAQLIFLDECGHAPPIEQPVAFAETLQAFLCRLPLN